MIYSMFAVQSQFEQYVQGLIDAKYARRGRQLTPEAADGVRRDILRQLDDFVMERAIPALSDLDVLLLEQRMIQTRSVEDAQEFIATHVPNFTDFLTNVLNEFAKMYLRR